MQEIGKSKKTPHTLGTDSLGIRKDELELRYGLEYSRGDMYVVSHKDAKGNLSMNKQGEKLEKASEVDVLKAQVALLMQINLRQLATVASPLNPCESPHLRLLATVAVPFAAIGTAVL
ncbi:hypothetical protein MTR_0464s0010 [Medicago truncatula]|uniref:Uncharacterized protein n=1 Tax=Medicago truncatula TaxID=3880 RepID=A0A072TQT2_MEDTR|nr:hypothetical protein MTR_0464s0010 [Medicago truncatula]